MAATASTTRSALHISPILVTGALDLPSHQCHHLWPQVAWLCLGQMHGSGWACVLYHSCLIYMIPLNTENSNCYRNEPGLVGGTEALGSSKW